MKGDVSEQKKKGKFTLDSFVRDGLFKAGKPDIGDIWAEQTKMRKEQIRINKIKAIQPKISVSTKVSKIGKNLKKTRLSTMPHHANKGLLLILVIVGIFVAKPILTRDSPTVSTLGATSEVQGSEDNRVQAPDFSVVYPLGKSPETLVNVTRKSPDGSVIHTFKDEIDGIGIEVTQQKLPDNFKSAPAVELEKVAKNFQATNIIQIDENLVFHGLQEKSGIQTLVTIKKDLLIFINSSQKQPDDSWVGYITSLK